MRLFLLCILVMLPFLTNGQSLPAPEKAYEAAFNHIKHDRQLRRMGYNLRDISVFDSIVHIGLLSFSQQLGPIWGYGSHRKEIQLIDSLQRVDERNFYKPYFSELTAHLTKNRGLGQGCTVIVFSRLDNNMLLAEVSNNDRGGPGLHNIFTTFDQSLFYLFILGPDGTIQRHYVQPMNYN